MVYEKREPRWREWLTAEESRRIAEIDAAAEQMDLMKAERQLISNRAIQRARYADRTAKKATKPRRERESKRKP